jgi:hypothetical protein
MPKIEIEILNTNAMSKLKELEEQNMIRFGILSKKTLNHNGDFRKYRGAISKENRSSLDNQLNELRSEWG